MVLLVILRVGDEAYGVLIAREIEQTAGRTVLLGAVYAALDRLDAMGLVSSTIGDPTPERGGRAKRFFRVTPKGLRAVRDTQRALMALWTNVPALAGRSSCRDSDGRFLGSASETIPTFRSLTMRLNRRCAGRGPAARVHHGCRSQPRSEPGA